MGRKLAFAYAVANLLAAADTTARSRFLPMVFRRLALPALLLLSTSLWGQPSPEEGRLLSCVHLPEDYRGEIQISSVTQTSDGLIYAANLGAIKEYDGRVWRSLPTPTAWVMALAAAPDGRVYYAANDDIGLLELGADGRRACRSLLELVPPAFKPLGQVYGCAARPDGIYWASTTKVLRWRDGAMHVWNFPDNASLTLRDGGQHLYLASAADALYRMSGDTWLPLSRDSRVARDLPGVFDEWAGRGPVAVDARGAGWLIATDGTVSEGVPALPPEEVGIGVAHAVVLRDGRLALATKGRGLLVRTPDGEIDLRFGLDGGTGSVSMLELFQDREDGLWISSKYGVTRVDLDRGVTRHDERTGSPSNIGLGTVRHDGVFYVGAEDGIYRFLPAGEARRGRFERVPGPVFFASALFSHRSGGLVAAGDRGLYRLVEGQFVPDCPLPENIFGLAESISDPARVFAVGGESVRTLRWDGTVWRDEGVVQGFRHDVTSLAEDRDGSLWGGTSSDGVFRLQRRPGHSDWQTAQSDTFGTDRGLPAGHEWVSVFGTPLGPLFAHSRGVSAYDPATNRLVPSAAFAAVGRADRYAFPLASRPDGTIWAQLGNPARGELLEIGGVRPTIGGGWNWMPLPARVAGTLGYLGANALDWEPAGDGAGLLWVMGQRCFLRVDLDAALAQRPLALPVAALRDIGRGALVLPLTPTVAPVLAFARDELRFRYACATFVPAGKLDFQHRLRGYDEAWSDWTERHEAAFTNLPAGDYAFEVRARRSGGEPGPIANWRFVMRPPWWRSPAAAGLAIAAALTAVWLFVRWRLGALERDRRRLESVVRERTEELARERDHAAAANRAKTLFLANMSHELRTPLHAILGYSQLLGADPALPDAARERLQIVGSSGRHLLRLINEVLDLSKIEAGKLELQPAPFDLPALLAALAAAHAPRAAAKGLDFRHSDPAGLPSSTLGDSAKLRQVLENLLGNAIKFTAHGEVRLLALPAAAGRVRFEVSDGGPGISATDLAGLFQPFTQLAPVGMPSAEGGTGLGLAIAQRLVALMGGKLEVASTVGEGSRFWFELPLAPAQAAETPTRPPRRIVGYEGPRRRVLAVDDVEANRRLFADLLAPLGFEMTEAGSAAETLARLDTFRPDLVLLDLRLPDLDGISLARRLRADPRLEGVKLLAASASAFNQDPAEALAAGCDGFIAKPFLPEEFFARLAELLGLVWREVDEAPVPAAEPLDPALLAALRTAAGTGDVVAMRDAFGRLKERHAGAAALGPLGQAITAFDTTGIMRLTEPSRPAPR